MPFQGRHRAWLELRCPDLLPMFFNGLDSTTPQEPKELMWVQQQQMAPCLPMEVTLYPQEPFSALRVREGAGRHWLL